MLLRYFSFYQHDLRSYAILISFLNEKYRHQRAEIRSHDKSSTLTGDLVSGKIEQSLSDKPRGVYANCQGRNLCHYEFVIGFWLSVRFYINFSRIIIK